MEDTATMETLCEGHVTDEMIMKELQASCLKHEAILEELKKKLLEAETKIRELEPQTRTDSNPEKVLREHEPAA